MTEDDKVSPESDNVVKNAIFKGKERKERSRPLTKIVCRRLPPTMTEESFLEQVSPIPEYDYFYFSKPDMTLSPNVFSRAYINFLTVDDIFMFRDKFDDYIFVDDKGNEYPAVVEYAPFQRLPKKRRKKDPKCATLETDPMYLEFLESLKETDSDSREPKMEYSYQPTEEKKETTTPLLEFLAQRRREERRRKEDRQRRRQPRNRNSKEEEGFEDDVKKIKPRENEKEKPMNKKKDDDSASIKNENVIDYKDKEKVHGKGVTKNFRETRKSSDEHRKKGDFEKKEYKSKESTEAGVVDGEKAIRKDRKERREFPKEKPKEVKKYSDTRKEKLKPGEKRLPSFRQLDENEIEATAVEYKTGAVLKTPESSVEKTFPPKSALQSSKIKPFTQLPQYKPEDLPKVIDELDKTANRARLESNQSSDNEVHASENKESDVVEGNIECFKFSDIRKDKILPKSKESSPPIFKMLETVKENQKVIDVPNSSDETVPQRRSSLESSESRHSGEETPLRRHKSLDDKSQDPMDSTKNNLNLHKHKDDPRTERRIRNKDRPSIVIYQPGMGKFSKQRLEREKDSPAGTYKQTEPGNPTDVSSSNDAED